MEQPVVADFHKPFRQHVGKKAPDEAVDRQHRSFLRSRFALGVAKRDGVVCYLLDAVVAERDAEDVWREIFEGACPIPNRAAVYNPRFDPGAGVNLTRPRGLAQGRAKFRSKQLAKRFDMHQGIAVPDQPPFAICSQGKGRHQIVDVRVVAQVARPGLQDAQHANLATQKV
jgi:hypothetical protein